MRFNKENCDANSKIFRLTKEVANKYIECLNNKGTFSMKLKRLVVIPFELPIKTVYGQTWNNQRENHVLFVYNETMSDQKIAFVIAHELAHILFYPQGDLLLFQKRRKVRYQENGVECLKEYRFLDEKLEEAMANHLAYFIVSKMPYEDKEDQLRILLEGEGYVKKHELITKKEILFGKRLMECEKIDEYEIVENDVIIANSLWYNAVTHFLY